MSQTSLTKSNSSGWWRVAESVRTRLASTGSSSPRARESRHASRSHSQETNSTQVTLGTIARVFQCWRRSWRSNTPTKLHTSSRSRASSSRLKSHQHRTKSSSSLTFTTTQSYSTMKRTTKWRGERALTTARNLRRELQKRIRSISRIEVTYRQPPERRSLVSKKHLDSVRVNLLTCSLQSSWSKSQRTSRKFLLNSTLTSQSQASSSVPMMREILQHSESMTSTKVTKKSFPSAESIRNVITLAHQTKKLSSRWKSRLINKTHSKRYKKENSRLQGWCET